MAVTDFQVDENTEVAIVIDNDMKLDLEKIIHQYDHPENDQLEKEAQLLMFGACCKTNGSSMLWERLNVWERGRVAFDVMQSCKRLGKKEIDAHTFSQKIWEERDDAAKRAGFLDFTQMTYRRAEKFDAISGITITDFGRDDR